MRVTNIVIERDVLIDSSPDTVYAFLTDPAKIVAWMGKEATVDLRPGGLFRVRYNDVDIVRGEFVDLFDNARVAMTWVWEAEGAETPPGASVVEITLTPVGEATLLRLTHRGLSDAEARSHAEGWDFFLPKLVAAVH
jgi:uncharacterized protein YndB with AHSA1/START domain